jgi:hypothetical protein
LIEARAGHPHSTSQRHAPVVFLGFPFFPHNVRTVNFSWIGSLRVRFLTVVFLLMLAPGIVPARAKPKVAKVDSDYGAALALADRFLNAWQTQDQESGLLMLTDTAKQHWSEDRLGEFFSPGENAAYQVSGGKKLKAGRYAFPVALLSSPPNRQGRKRFSEIIVMRTGGQDWAVDKLP